MRTSEDRRDLRPLSLCIVTRAGGTCHRWRSQPKFEQTLMAMCGLARWTELQSPIKSVPIYRSSPKCPRARSWRLGARQETEKDPAEASGPAHGTLLWPSKGWGQAGGQKASPLVIFRWVQWPSEKLGQDSRVKGTFQTQRPRNRT